MTDNRAPSRFPWPPLVLVAALSSGFVLGAWLPLPWIPSPLADVLLAIGWLMVMLVVLLDVQAIRALWRAKTTVQPHKESDQLVTGGPFALTRNPIYVGYVALIIAAALIAGNAWFLPLAVLAAIALRKFAIDGEERHLAAKFGRRYRDYTKRVRRWF